MLNSPTASESCNNGGNGSSNMDGSYTPGGFFSARFCRQLRNVDDAPLSLSLSLSLTHQTNLRSISEGCFRIKTTFSLPPPPPKKKNFVLAYVKFAILD